MRRIPVEKRKVTTTIALSYETIERIDKLAEKLKRSRSSIVAQAINNYFEVYDQYEEDQYITDVTEEEHDETYST